MAILQIITAPDPILEKKSAMVGTVDSNVQNLMNDMLSTMYDGNGVGLAAVQVGVLKKVIVLDLQNDDDTGRAESFYPLFMADPEIIMQSEETSLAFEGCLSVPEQRIEVERPQSIKVRFLDYDSKTKELDACGWLARAIQHEIDHMNGELLIHYLTGLKRDVAKRKLQKLKKYSS